VPIEIPAMQMSGHGDILGDFTVVEVAAQSSSGVAKSASPGVVFPMNIDLDARVEIQLSTLGRTLVPQVPPHLHGMWSKLPETGIAIDGNNQPTMVVDKLTGMPAGSIDFFYIVLDSTCTWAPPAAVEIFTASGSATIELFGTGTAVVPLSGSGIAARGPGRDTGGGTLRVDTELRSLVLGGNQAPVGAIALNEDPSRASTGSFTGNMVGALLPATGSCNVFLSVLTSQGTLRPAAAVPIATTATVTVLPPPGGTTWALTGGAVDLKNANGFTRGRLLAWTLVTGTATPWPTDAPPPGEDAIATDAVLASLALERNPVRGAVRFRLALDRRRDVELHVYDARGARVVSFERAGLAPGVQWIEWDGRNDSGREASAGLYFYRVVVDGRERGGKLVRLAR